MSARRSMVSTAPLSHTAIPARSVSPEPRLSQVAMPTLAPTWSDRAASWIGRESS